MMQIEFEQAVGIHISNDTFDRINEVYMESEFFQSKEQLYSFYKHYDMNGIERMYKDVLVKKRLSLALEKAQDENAELLKELEQFKKLKDSIDINKFIDALMSL